MADTKNKGPLLVSYGAGDINALPIEWRARMGFRQEDQQMPLGFVLEPPDFTDPPDPAPAFISEDRLVQTRTDERKRTSVTLNPPPPNGGQVPPGGGPPDSWTLVSEQRVPWGQVATRTRAFVPQGSHLVLTDDMLQAEQKNLGIGLDQDVLTCPLPGPQIVDTKWDEISSLVSTVKRRKLVAQIVDGETIVGGLWTQTSRQGETATVASEIIETRTLPSSSLVSTKFDPESVLVTTTKTKRQASTFVDGETIVGNVWTRRTREGQTGLVALELVESRTLPGPTIISWRIEEDGTLVTLSKTKKLTSAIVEGETATSTLWTKVYGDGETALISTEIVETRALPTALVTTTKFDQDSTVVTITRQKKLATQITTTETVTPTLWTKTYKDGDSGLVATQVTESRVLPGATLLSTRFDQDGVLVSVAKTKKKSDQFTDGESIAGSVWTKTYRDSETSQVATEIKETRTIPGPTIESYRIDDDGDVIVIDKTKKLLSTIAEGELATSATQWKKTYAEGETALVATEVVETRPLGGSAKTVESARIDDDGAIVTIRKTKKRLADIVEAETVTATLWTKVYTQGITGPVATEVVETRGLGTSAPTVRSSRLERDGLIVNITKVKKKADTVVDPVETATASLWTRTYRENVDGLVATEVSEAAALPGPDVITTEVQPDGRVKTITKARVLFSSVTSSEAINTNVWTKIYKEGESGKLATRVTETLNVGRNASFTLPSANVDSDEVVVTTVKSILDKTLITPAATVAGGVVTRIEEKEVSHLVSEEIKSTFSFLDKAKYSVAIENPLPAQFKSLANITETTHIVSGTAAVPVLGAYLERSQEQVDKLLKRTVDRTIDTGTFPITWTGKEITTEYGGLLLTTEKKIDLQGAASLDIVAADVTDKSVVRAKRERFGAYAVREKATYAGAYPILIGGTVDPETNFVETFTQQVVDEGAVATAGNGSLTEIKPLDAARSLKTVKAVNTTNLNAFKLVFPGTTDISIPPQLTAITGIGNAVGGGSGSSSEGGTYTINGQGSGQMRQDVKAHSSAHAMLDLQYTVKQVWGQNIACTHYLFFMLGPSITYSGVLTKLRSAPIANDATIAAWPKFQPTAVNLTIVGAKVVTSAEATKFYSDTVVADYLGRPTRGGSARSGGGGTSQEVDIFVKTVTIPATIHASITIATNAVTSNLFGAVASVTSPGSQVASSNSQAGSHIYPTTVNATAGQSTIPSGKFIHRMRVEPWKYNFFKIDCEVVNSADW